MTTHTLKEEQDVTARPRGAADTGEGEVRAAISIQHVSKTYPIPLTRVKQFFRLKTKQPVVALTDVSFNVWDGEIFGLIGRNGAGKTTLTKIIATLIQPTSGAALVRGFDSVREEERVRSLVGLASAEERSFYWRLTGEQNLTFFARLYGLPSREARTRIAELLTQFELEEVARRRFGEMSTGNKQRMAVARAMLNSPPVLLLDEPTRSLDPLAAARMRAVIGSLARSTKRVTVLLTSHNLAEIEELCPRVAVISRGRIRAIDTPAHLRARQRRRESVRLTLSETTREHVEQLLMNLVDELETTREGARVVARFSRDDGDLMLDEALRALVEGGARVLDCATERGSLLDVLEAYEQDADAHDAGGVGKS
ncbi:MAG TPA: ABC transporter ATP-binding protein [Pyrinomonadaceae bacterium]|nr:ABC transporter ATP-binding protein [Pyrinomonadaceae bacterium]